MFLLPCEILGCLLNTAEYSALDASRRRVREGVTTGDVDGGKIFCFRRKMKRRSGRTYGRTDGRTDRRSYRDARRHVKRMRVRTEELMKKPVAQKQEMAIGTLARLQYFMMIADRAAALEGTGGDKVL